MCSRELDGETIEFGTAGYTRNNVFVLYDRNTDSVWYPLTDHTFNAVAGPNRNKSLEYLAKPNVMRLREWVKGNPDTLVLLPPEHMSKNLAAREARRQLMGSWEMETDFNGQVIEAVMILSGGRQGMSGTWSSMGREMEMMDVEFDADGTLRFTREIGPDQVLQFEGTVKNGRIIEGGWSGAMGELECRGEKVEKDS